MDSDRIDRSLKRIAFEIVEHASGIKGLAIAGIHRRGFLVAEGVARHLQQIEQHEIPLLKIDTDAGKITPTPKESCTYLVLVDDVIFSGSTMLEALRLIDESLTYEQLHAAALLDRGHRKLPIEAQFVGMYIPTKVNEHISVRHEGERLTEVVLTKGHAPESVG